MSGLLVAQADTSGSSNSSGSSGSLRSSSTPSGLSPMSSATASPIPSPSPSPSPSPTPSGSGSGLSGSSDDVGIKSGGFEGPEKVLEVDFVKCESSSLRKLGRDRWDAILSLARCQILTQTSNAHFDAYVLSESSLFVYDHKVFVKTCGTTTLLRCLPLLLEEADRLGLVLEWLGYTRKNFMFPDSQEFPHGSFSQEIEYTKQCSGPSGTPLKGGAYILGDLLADHWYVYVADYSSANQSKERNVNIMMFGLDPDVCKRFHRCPHVDAAADASRVRAELGLEDLCGKGALVDDVMFDPCGYSLNAMEGADFYTLHVTPELDCSYASFETNMETSDYSELVRKAVAAFRPQRVVVTMFADEAALAAIAVGPTDRKLNHYVRKNQSTTCFEEDYSCRMSVYESNEPAPAGIANPDATDTNEGKAQAQAQA